MRSIFVTSFYDRYNWDGGKKVNLFGIEVTDHFMGEFHRQGLAQEFDRVGVVRRRLTWREGEEISRTQVFSRGGNQQRG